MWLIKAIFWLMVLACISSCSSTQVHLFTGALEDEEIAFFDQLLTSEGYKVLHNSLQTPKSIVAASIVYSPRHKNLKQIEQLRDVLASEGLQFDLEPVSSGNHFYTGTNVGVYPKAYSSVQEKRPSLIGTELFGECTQIDATLELSSDLTFKAEFFVWQEKSQTEVKRIERGIWRRDNDKVILMQGKLEALYTVSDFSYWTDYAAVEGVRLEAAEATGPFSDCDFVHTELDPN